jgi:N-alpha-acetyl-L-2,4-diaminobutyrate deacetylase
VFVGPGAKDDKGLVAFGANHGNEYEGPVAIKHLLSEIDLKEVTGRIILVPVLNPSAFRSGTRSSDADDGVNLNRAFVDGAGTTSALGGITHRVARFVRERIWPHVHVVLDLHAGGNVARFAPCASFHPVEDAEQSRAIEETARGFGTPFLLVYQNQTPGLLPSEGERLGKITVGCELGWGEAVSPIGVRCGKRGVLSAAMRHGQLRSGSAKLDPPEVATARTVSAVRRECVVPAPWPGHFEPLLDCGARVSAGQTVALLHDFNRIDELPWPVRAGVDGYVLAQAWGAVVRQGQHILVVGEEV